MVDDTTLAPMAHGILEAIAKAVGSLLAGAGCGREPRQPMRRRFAGAPPTEAHPAISGGLHLDASLNEMTYRSARLPTSDTMHPST